ncbi:hypothetical protein AB4254_09045 [Vibrio breoganii]
MCHFNNIFFDKSDLEEVSYLPMRLDSFKELYDLAIESGEIASCMVVPHSDTGEKYVVAFLVENRVYQSSLDDYKVYK